jgi:hypothetical protein
MVGFLFTTHSRGARPEVTSEYIVTIKLLVAAWPESANTPRPPSDPDDSRRFRHQTIQMRGNTVYNAVVGTGFEGVAASHPPLMSRLRALWRHTVWLNYLHRRAPCLC